MGEGLFLPKHNSTSHLRAQAGASGLPALGGRQRLSLVRAFGACLPSVCLCPDVGLSQALFF